MSSQIQDVFNIADDELRVVFKVPVAIEGMDSLLNYSISPASAVIKKIIIPDPSGEAIAYLDLYVKGLKVESEYELTITSLYRRDSVYLGTQTISFVARTTKSSKMMSNMAEMYSTDIDTLLRQMLVALGFSDEQIGGEYVRRS